MDLLAPVISGIFAVGVAAGIAQYAKDRARSSRWEREGTLRRSAALHAVEPAVPYDGPIRPLLSPHEPHPKFARGGIVRGPDWGVTGEEAAINLKRALGGCQHQQAETVELCTGEVVACICIACLDRLPAGWIDDQRTRAEREARCGHRALLQNLQMGVGVGLANPHRCGECGAAVFWP